MSINSMLNFLQSLKHDVFDYFYYIDREYNQRTIPEALAKCLFHVNSVASVLVKQDT